MTLSTQQRRALLEVMGITTYQPRIVLPGAAPGPLVAWPPRPGTVEEAPAQEGRAQQPLRRESPSRNPSPESPPSPATPAATAARNLLEPTVGDGGGHDRAGHVESAAGSAPEAPAREAMPDPVAPEMSGPASTPLRFRLMLIPVNGRLSVIEQLPSDGDGRLPGQHQRLLVSLLRSLGLEMTTRDLKLMPFQWPLSDSSRFSGDAAAARNALRLFVEHNLSEGGEPAQSRVLWLMGDSLPDLLGIEEDIPHLKPVEALPGHVLKTPGLGQLLRVGSLKRDIWPQVRALRKFLHAA